VQGIPELVWACRREMSKVLRQEADAEIHLLIKRKLLELAARFEVGQ
jgi:hypothetical protein